MIASKERSDSIRSIEIGDFNASPKVIEDFLSLPKKLEHFAMEDRSIGSSRHLGTLEDAVRALSPHKATLRTIRLRDLSPSLSGFSLTGFDALEELDLAAGCTGVEIGQELLLAPRLRKFTWTFALEDNVSQGQNWFNQQEEDWIRRFAQAATERGLSLREIFIDLPRFDDNNEEGGLPDTYPFDRMDRVASEIRGAGITLSYPTPPISREEYYALLRFLE